MLPNRIFLAGASSFALAFVLAAVGAEPERLVDNLRTETELWRLEREWNEAHLRGDAEALNRLWDDELIVIVPKMRMIRKSEALDVVREGRVKFLRYETSDLYTHVFDDTAIVTGHLIRKRRFNDREVQDEWRFSKTYVRRKGEWRVVLWQTSQWAPE